jgi:hypothetical protein
MVDFFQPFDMADGAREFYSVSMIASSYTILTYFVTHDAGS